MKNMIKTVKAFIVEGDVILKTFRSKFEEHQSMMVRLSNCAELIESAGGLLLTQGGKLLLRGNVAVEEALNVSNNP